MGEFPETVCIGWDLSWAAVWINHQHLVSVHLHSIHPTAQGKKKILGITLGSSLPFTHIHSLQVRNSSSGSPLPFAFSQLPDKGLVISPWSTTATFYVVFPSIICVPQSSLLQYKSELVTCLQNSCQNLQHEFRIKSQCLPGFHDLSFPSLSILISDASFLQPSSCTFQWPQQSTPPLLLLQSGLLVFQGSTQNHLSLKRLP